MNYLSSVFINMAPACLIVYWDFTPQHQPGSYRGGDEDEMSVSLVEETGVPGGNHRPTASN